MHRSWVLFLLLLIGLMPFRLAQANITAFTVNEPENIAVAKDQLAGYSKSGLYEKHVHEVIQAVRKHVSKHHLVGAKSAVVLDIDETMISNAKFRSQFDYGFNSNVWKKWVSESAADSLPGMLNLYKHLRREGVTVFAVTGRRQQGSIAQDPTVRNLERLGFKGIQQYFFKPNRSGVNTVKYKSGIRKKIEAMGYTILANVGDQWSDLEGGHSMANFKMPNPFYRVK